MLVTELFYINMYNIIDNHGAGVAVVQIIYCHCHLFLHVYASDRAFLYKIM